MYAADTARDAGYILGAIIAALTLIAMLWAWSGGLRRWRERRERHKALEEFWDRFRESWEGRPAAPGFEHQPGWPENILSRLEQMADSVQRADQNALRAMRRGLRNEHFIAWLVRRLHAIETHLDIPHEEPPPAPLITDDAIPTSLPGTLVSSAPA